MVLNTPMLVTKTRRHEKDPYDSVLSCFRGYALARQLPQVGARKTDR
jgi:hypothetical protein